MFNKIVAFLDRYNVLYKHQYGFRAKHSTIHPILHFINNCAEYHNLDKKTSTLAIFCDLSKAFDIIDHDILLHKLVHYGLRGVVNDWLRSYLNNRKQYVELKHAKSRQNFISCGVPQGSILGPLLYLLYVNDIGVACDGKIYSFADDTTLLTSSNSVASLFDDANRNINRLYEWFCANKLSLNAKKTKYIIIRPANVKLDLTDHSIFIGGTKLSRVGTDCAEVSTKFLGVVIDEALSWKHHVTNVNSKIARAIFSIKQVKKFLPQSSLVTLYNALVHPHISYGILAWGCANISILNKTILLQKRDLRTIFNIPYNGHTEPLFKTAHILKLTDIYDYQILTFMNDYSIGRLPVSFNNIFRSNHEVQDSYATRQREQMYIARCNSTFSSKLPLYSFPRKWNEWFEIVRACNSRWTFKKHVKATMIGSYRQNIQCQNTHCKQCKWNNYPRNTLSPFNSKKISIILAWIEPWSETFMCDVTDVPCYICIYIYPVNAVMLNLKLNLHRFNLI